MTGELLARIVDQATTYGQLMLTPAEMVAYLDWRDAHPMVALAVGPGRVIACETLVVLILVAP